MKNKNLKLLPVILGFGCASLLLAGCSGSSATAKSKEKNRAEYPLFSNPVIYSDVPDVAVTRAGDDFYMVSTTMHLMPGAPVMKSKDLVNWEIASYLYDRIEDSPNYDLADGKTVYGQGQWASSIRYHKGKFYVLFCTNNPSRAYIYTTDDPSGKWEKYATIPQFHDPSLFFDDDDQVYIFYNSGEIVQLNEDLQSVKEGGLRKRLFDRDETENALLEGSQVIKHNGKYYLLMISWPQNSLRRQVCYRADNIEGPYEKRVILEHNFQNFGGVGQGCLIDTEDGDWYAMIFQDRGGIGRVPNLMPCRWVDGWPMLGDENGHVPVEMNSPVKGDVAVEPIIKSDNCTADYLGKNWQWNHNPDNEAWSLTERPGYLRLTTSRVVDNIFTAPNTIS